MTTLNFLESQDDGTIATVWLNRPPVNAVNNDMYLEVRELFSSIEIRFPKARAIVLAGRGRHFCAGNDLAEFKSMNPDNAPARMKIVREAFWAIYDSPVPVIAAVHGAAVGAWRGVAAWCGLIDAPGSAEAGPPRIN